MLIYYVLFLIIIYLCLSHKFSIQFLCDIFTPTFLLQTYQSTTYQFSITNIWKTLKDISLLGVSWSWWGRSRLRYKSPNFRSSLAIHYCNQLVLEIVMDLNMASSLLQLLISFLEAFWWVLVCYVLAITMTVRGLFVGS